MLGLNKFAVVFVSAMFFVSNGWCLDQNYIGNPVDVNVSIRLKDATFHIYNPSLKAMAEYKTMQEAKNQSPEDLMKSIVSETTQEWVDYNNDKGQSHTVSAEAFENRKQKNKGTNYFELIDKLQFSFDGTDFAIIKYWFVDDGKRTLVSGATLKRDGQKWVRTAIPGMEKLETLVARLKPEVFKDLLYASGPKNLSKKIIDRTRGDYGVLDADKLFSLITEFKDKKQVDKLVNLIDKNQ